ncbi:MAG: hypothetical protein ABIO44_02770, partial [Saprospiraceae bacterium]
MSYEGFEFYYPMPDDIAQSILISETENDIHLRTTNINSKKIWLYNKLLKNLLTNRKTLISIDTPQDAQILTDFLNEHQLESLCLFFTHSRSTNEKTLKEFKPLIVNGKILSKEFHDAFIHLRKTHSEFTNSIQSIYKKDSTHQVNLNSLLCRSIQLRQELSPYEGYQASQSNLSQKEYISLKQNLNLAIECSKGGDKFLSILDLLHSNMFEMFEQDESWNTIEHHLTDYKKYISRLLALIQICKENWIKSFIQVTQEKIIPNYKFLIECSLIEHLTSEERIQVSFISQQLKSQIPEITQDTALFEIETFLKLNLEQILLLINESAQQKWENGNISISESSEINSSIEDIALQVKIFEHKLHQNAIVQEQIISTDSILELKQNLHILLDKFNAILKLKPYFSLYFEWKKFLLNCTLSQVSFLQDISLTPTLLWHKFLELSFVEKQINQLPIFEVSQFNQKSERFNQSIVHYKNKLIPFIKGRFESIQHKNISKLCDSEIELSKLLDQHVDSLFSLTDYYQKLPLLSELFPIIVLDNAKEEYYPNLTKTVWDEIIVLNEEMPLSLNDKISNGAHRRISLHHGQTTESAFNIALLQAPPDILKDILYHIHHSESFTTIKNLTNFIFANQTRFTVLINANDCIISFMPIEMTKLILQMNSESYNLFQVSEEQDFERVNEWLLYKSTKKKIWCLDTF